MPMARHSAQISLAAAETPLFTIAPALAKLPVTHGFFGRQGGISKGPYFSLNCGYKVGDELENARENCARVCAALQVDPQKRYGLNQVHGTLCHVITDQCWAFGKSPEGDAMVSDRPGVSLSVLSADCAPVLFATDNVIGAAHAGWGGAIKGVLEATIAAMENLGAKREAIRAAIGPCIGWKSYEVSHGFEKPFLQEDQTSEKFFREGVKDKLMFDLSGYCAYRLRRAGIAHVSSIDHDTCRLEDQYFSHRRATLRGESQRGLQMSLISLKRA